MSILFASLGIIFGSVYFVIGDHRIFLAALVSFVASSVIFTSLAYRRKEIISFLIFFLLVFFNYNSRSEHLEFFDLENYLNANKSSIYYQIVSPPKDRIFYSEFIIQAKNKKQNLTNHLKDFFLPYRFLARTKSTQGLEEGDIVNISDIHLHKLDKFNYKINKKNKVFYGLDKTDISFVASNENSLTKLQKNIKEYFFRTLDFENAQIVNSLLLGAKTASPPEKFSRISYKLGIGHFLAASGFQLVVLGFLINFIFKSLKLNFYFTNITTLVLVIVYAALAGFSPSITRAAICVAAFLLLQLSKRHINSKRFLVILAGVVLFIDPYTIFDLGFQFSYLATLALMTWASPIEQRLEFIKIKFIREAIAITLSVQIFLLPLSIYYFGNLQIWSILANITLTPILTLITLLSFFGLSFIIEPILNVVKYLIYHAKALPGLDSSYNPDLTTTVLLTLFLNIIAFILVKPKISIPNDKEFINSIHSRHYDENIYLFLKKIFVDGYMQISLLISTLALLFAVSLHPFNTTVITIDNGLIKNYNELNQVIKNKSINYKYLDYQGLKILVIKNRSSLKRLGGLTEDLREVDILILPNLNNQDIYLNTLIELVKPQFILCSISKKTEKNLSGKIPDTHNDVDGTLRIDSNLEIITSKAHTVLGSGVLYISKGKFWNLI